MARVFNLTEYPEGVQPQPQRVLHGYRRVAHEERQVQRRLPRGFRRGRLEAS